MLVEDLCSKNVLWTTRDRSLLEAAEMMRENHVGDVVVIEETDSGRKPVGILTDRDVVIAAAEKGPDALTRKTAGQRMSDVLIVARNDDSVDDILSNMKANGVRRVPVIDEHDDLVGILTFDDLIDYYGRQVSTLAGVVREELEREIRGD